MNDLVQEVLAKAAEDSLKYKLVDVEKLVDLEYDLGNLLAIDNNPIDITEYRNDRQTYLVNLARDNTQLLLNQIWKLQAGRKEDAVVVKLPPPSTRLPREKHVPKPKPLTKWERFAKEKGIQSSKKSRLAWDEELKRWVPRYGYQRRKAEKEKNWMRVVPGNADQYEDQFVKANEKRKERVAKNELQRLRNLARAQKVKVPSVGVAPKDIVRHSTASELEKTVGIARKSTASLGKFTKVVPKEKPTQKNGRKRKFDPLMTDAARENSRNLEILTQIQQKRPRVDTEKAANKQLHNEEVQRRESKQGKPKKGKGGQKKRKGGGGPKLGKGRSKGLKGHKRR